MLGLGGNLGSIYSGACCLLIVDGSPTFHLFIYTFSVMRGCMLSTLHSCDREFIQTDSRNRFGGKESQSRYRLTLAWSH